MAEDAKKSKDRSPNFPFINLESALARAQQFYAKEKRSAAPFSVVAQHWHYSASSSGALQTVAALKSYGLMVDEGGSGSKRTLRLTDLALRILLDQRPDGSERAAYMRQAALSPTVAADIYAKWPEGFPSSSTLQHYLVFERGFGDQKAKSVVRILVENEHLTGSSYEDFESQSNQMVSSSAREMLARPPMFAGGGEAQPAFEPKDSYPRERMMARPTGSTMAGGGNTDYVSGHTGYPSGHGADPGHGRPPPERLAFKGAEILIYFDGEPDVATLDFIERYIRLRKELLQN